jgi:hypothetical protein
MAIRSLESRHRIRARQGRPVQEKRDVPSGQRWCPDCETFKALDEFPANRGSHRAGRGGYCKPCHNTRGRENVIKNHGSTRDFHLRRRYGIDSTDFDRMLAEQGGKCAGCHLVAPNHVDHDHATGVVRGLLCFNCNQALGNVRDNPAVLVGLLGYLRRAKRRAQPIQIEEHDFSSYDVVYNSQLHLAA